MPVEVNRSVLSAIALFQTWGHGIITRVVIAEFGRNSLDFGSWYL